MSVEPKYKLVSSARYKRDYRKLARSGRYDLKKLNTVISLLQNDKPLPKSLKNHRLKGAMKSCEECHIEGDWLLIYQKNDDEFTLVALRTGTHSELFGK